MVTSVRVMVEEGKKKRVVASAFDWPGWDRSATLGHDAVAVLDSYRHRFANVATMRRQLACPPSSARDREHHLRGEPARSWALQFLIRRCAWHMLDHAWELEDRDLSGVE